MKEQTLRNCELLIENRDRAKSVFHWDGGLIHLACAGICTAKGIVADVAALENSRELLKENVGVFSTSAAPPVPLSSPFWQSAAVQKRCWSMD